MNDQKKLFEAITHGNESAFTEVMRTHFPKLLQIAFRITKSHQTAEDIVQEAFLSLWIKRKEINTENLGGWLYTVVTHSGYKHIKRESQRNHIYYSLQTNNNKGYNNGEESLIQKEDAAFVNKVYARLPERQRIVYLLNRENGLSRNEIAGQLNISPNTVKVHLLKAVQFLKEHVKSACLFLVFAGINSLFFYSTNTKYDPEDLNIKGQIHHKKMIEQNSGHLLFGSCLLIEKMHIR